MKEAKCIIWDLDNTIWDGVLLEDKNVTLKEDISEIIKELDKRGILQSIASKNNHEDAIGKLKEFGLDEYFLYPEINWNAKSQSVKNIKENINIGFDTLIFIDDQPFERDEVNSELETVECIDALEYKTLLENPRLNPKFITSDSEKRRKMYMDDIKRKVEEEEYQGPEESFLKTLNMVFKIKPAGSEDLKRALELTERTHQLNSTGVTFSYEELDNFRTSDTHRLYVCELTDKYGSYGKIGLALVELKENENHLKLLLMSCRVMSRGVGSLLLYHIMNETKKDGKKLIADFLRTDRNKIMYVTYKFANFKEIERSDDGHIVFENDLTFIPPNPDYIKIEL
jgi:FkbH-like protein